MATKNSILVRLDAELAALEKNTSFDKRDDVYFSELQIKTALRNVLYNIPLSDRMAGLLDKKTDILHSLMAAWVKLNVNNPDMERDDFYEAVHMYLEELDYDDRNTQLYDRASSEYAGFIGALEQKTPQEIIEKAYEITLKADILCLLESHHMSKKKIDVLLTLEKPLDSIYTEWMDNGHSHMDMLQQTMDDLIDTQEYDLDIHQFDHDGKIPDIMRDYYAEYEERLKPEQEEAGSDAERC